MVIDATLKAVAIVGAGTAGLAMMKTLLDLPEAQRRSWNIVVFDRQSEVGGLWPVLFKRHTDSSSY